MTVRGGGRPRAAAWLSCRTTEWVRRLGASLTDAHPCIMVTDLDGPPNTRMRREVFDAAEAGSPRHRHANHRQRAVVLGAVKVWPGSVVGHFEVLAARFRYGSRFAILASAAST